MHWGHCREEWRTLYDGRCRRLGGGRRVFVAEANRRRASGRGTDTSWRSVDVHVSAHKGRHGLILFVEGREELWVCCYSRLIIMPLELFNLSTESFVVGRKSMNGPVDYSILWIIGGWFCEILFVRDILWIMCIFGNDVIYFTKNVKIWSLLS